MARHNLHDMLDEIRKAVGADSAAVSDAQLLERFAASQDEAAFELLVWRHGRLVHGVCRRLLRNSQDAEDAFQATFLALARKAGAIGKPAAVGCWLYRVAYRVALAVRRRRAKTAAREQSTPPPDCAAPLPEVSPVERAELRAVLDEELARLPERFRAPTVLCYLEGRTLEEAAAQLGCPKGTVASRLARARERLRGRLVRRGLVLPAAGVGAAVCEAGASAAAPAALVRAALLCVSSRAGTAVSGQVVALTEGVLRTMLLRKLVTVTAVLTALAALLVGGGLVFQSRADDADEALSARAVAPAIAAPQDAPAKQPRQEKPPLKVTIRRPRLAEVAPYEVFNGRLEAGQVILIWPQQTGYLMKVGFKPGADVKKGDLLFQLDTRPQQALLEQNQAKLAAAQAHLEIASQQLHRMKMQAVPQKMLDEQQAKVAAAQSGVTAARAQVEQTRASVEAAKVLAPIDGRVTRPLVDPGNLASTGPPATLLTTVLALDPMRVVFDIDERSFLRYRRLMREDQVKGPGSSIYLGLADEDGFPHTGDLDSFDNVVRPETGTVTARGLVPNADKLLLPGASVRVQVVFGKYRRLPQVPEEALVEIAGRKFVYVVNDQNVLERRNVTLGQRIRDWRVIEKGLRPDDWVVVGRAAYGEALRPGAKIEPRRVRPEQK